MLEWYIVKNIDRSKGSKHVQIHSHTYKCYIEEYVVKTAETAMYLLYPGQEGEKSCM